MNEEMKKDLIGLSSLIKNRMEDIMGTMKELASDLQMLQKNQRELDAIIAAVTTTRS